MPSAIEGSPSVGSDGGGGGGGRTFKQGNNKKLNRPDMETTATDNMVGSQGSKDAAVAAVVGDVEELTMMMRRVFKSNLNKVQLYQIKQASKRERDKV